MGLNFKGGQASSFEPLKGDFGGWGEAEGFGFSGKELGAVEEVIEVSSKRAIQEALEEGEEVGTLSWSSSCLAKFSRCIGMLTEGFKGEILILLKRMKERKD